MTVSHKSLDIGEDFRYYYKATIVRIIDGDTVVVNIDLGYEIIMSRTLRLYDYDAPEVSTQEGKEARDFLKTFLPTGREVIVQSIKDKSGKYGRYLALVHLKEGFELTAYMKELGYVKKQ